MNVTGMLFLLAVVLGLACEATTPQGGGALGADFRAKSATNQATIRLAGPIDKVFPLFGPVEEKKWVPGWNPQVVSPEGVSVAPGMVFLTQEHSGTMYWVVTRYASEQHAVAYANVVPGFIVNRIEIQCRAAGKETECSVMYAHVALSEEANRWVETQDATAYSRKMAHWTEAINHWLTTGRTIEMHR